MTKLPYRELKVWQRSQRLADQVLTLGESRPFANRFFFRDQMCDAAMSVPANIAEGNGRSTPLDYASFLDRSRGSLFELDTWLFTAANRGWIPTDLHESLEDEIQQLSAMLLRMTTTLRRQKSLSSRAQ
ncbi:MAG: four helix bundle protein [Dehalococcoidia bacterium]